MPAYKTGKKTRQYTNEFKVTAVLLTYKPNRMIKDVAEDLDLHVFMQSRWRKKYREGKLVADKRKLPKQLSKIVDPEPQTDTQRMRQLEAARMLNSGWRSTC